MANYGDVALNLPANWNRRSIHNPDQALWIIGHQDGVADLYRTAEPDLRHQFVWCDPKAQTSTWSDFDKHRLAKYAFVKKEDGWTKNDELWDWDGEGFLTCRFQRAMYRTADLYEAEKAARERAKLTKKQQADADDEAAKAAARRMGIEVDEDYEPVQKRGRRR